jgi:hypothetical protein
MKIMVSTILLILSIQGVAGMKYYNDDVINEYDRATGLYFNVIKKEVKEGGFISTGKLKYNVDINIFDPKTGKSKTIFQDQKLRKIESMWFETHYDIDKKMMLFNDSSRYQIVKNNHDIDKRRPKNKLLIAVYNLELKLNELWVSSKQGEDLKKIKSFNNDYSWHIDSKNSKIRFIKPIKNRLSIESIDW